jgi:septal ring factor EnvC (AmiA/AmiB activator)
MVKEKHSVYIDTEKFESAKRQGINVSQVLENALDKFGQDENFEYTLQLDYLASQITEREQKLEAIDKERGIVEKQLKTVKDEYKRVSKAYKQEESAISMSNLLATLNRVINACEFDEARVKIAAEDILPQIYKLNRRFDLTKHIAIVEETYS